MCDLVALQFGRQFIQSFNQVRHEFHEAVALFDGCCKVGLQLLQCRFPSVQAAVNPCIKMSTDDAASRHKQHAIKSNLAIKRAKLKIAVVQNKKWANQTKNHVQAKPDLGGANRMQKSYALA